jgi:hypothetical protein
VLGVPGSQIVFLADEEATQREISKQFDHFLLGNANIQRDDAIILFFAGHGSQPDAPQGWLAENNKIETLCSHDVRTDGEDGEEVWGISDRAIDVLMRRLASEKTDNIVCLSLLFSSCTLHGSGSFRLPCSTAVIQVVSREPKRRRICGSGLSHHPLILRLQILTEKFGHPSRNLALGLHILWHKQAFSIKLWNLTSSLLHVVRVRPRTRTRLQRTRQAACSRLRS